MGEYYTTPEKGIAKWVSQKFVGEQSGEENVEEWQSEWDPIVSSTQVMLILLDSHGNREAEPLFLQLHASIFLFPPPFRPASLFAPLSSSYDPISLPARSPSWGNTKIGGWSGLGEDVRIDNSERLAYNLLHERKRQESRYDSRRNHQAIFWVGWEWEIATVIFKIKFKK